MMFSIFIVSGPSGSGKTTLVKRLLEANTNASFSVSHTTRKKRKGEVEGSDYYFINENEFKLMIEDGKFAEWAIVHNNYYGTSFKEIEEKSKGDKILVLDIDVQGAKNIKKLYKTSLAVLILPPSIEILIERLIKREGKMDNDIEKRLSIARNEILNYKLYDYAVINDNLDIAFNELNTIFKAYENKTFRKEEFILRNFGDKK